MIYGGDTWATLPTTLMFSPLAMVMAITAAKDMYDKAEKRLDDFYTKYGDFYSPIENDNSDYYKYVVSPVINKIDELYSKGIDPLRSKEGRIQMARAVRGVDKAAVALFKTNADLKTKYDALKNQLVANNKWSQEYEDWMRQQQGLLKEKDFRTITVDNEGTPRLNTWSGAPNPYKNPYELFSPLVQHLKAHTLTPEEYKAETGLTPKQFRKYTGLTKQDLKDAIVQGVPGLENSMELAFLRDDIRQRLGLDESEAKDPTNAKQIDDALLEFATNSVLEYRQRPVESTDEVALNIWKEQKADQRAYNRSGGGSNKGGLSADPFRHMLQSAVASAVGANTEDLNNEKNTLAAMSLIASRAKSAKSSVNVHKNFVDALKDNGFVTQLTQTQANMLAGVQPKDGSVYNLNMRALISADQYQDIFSTKELYEKMYGEPNPTMAELMKAPKGSVLNRFITEDFDKTGNFYVEPELVLIPEKDGRIHYYIPLTNDGHTTMYKDTGIKTVNQDGWIDNNTYIDGTQLVKINDENEITSTTPIEDYGFNFRISSTSAPKAAALTSAFANDQHMSSGYTLRGNHPAQVFDTADNEEAE